MAQMDHYIAMPSTKSSTQSNLHSRTLSAPATAINSGDTAVLQCFEDIISGTECDRSKDEIMTDVKQKLKDNMIWTRITDSKQRRTGAMLGRLAHKLHLLYPPSDQLPLRKDKQLNTFLKYCVRHALASYRGMRLAFGTKEPAIIGKSLPLLLELYYGIKPDGVILDETDNAPQKEAAMHCPRFYVAVDHNHKRVVLSVRGTQTSADVITDMNGSAKPFSAFGVDGFAHEGMLAAAKYVFDRVTVALIEQCTKWSTYQLILAGHSMGGAVAALLGLMYYKHPVLFTQNRLRVVAFACPPIVSQSFIDSGIGMDYITCVALGSDFITRVSIESIKLHNRRSDLILNSDKAVVDKCMRMLDSEQEVSDLTEIDEEVQVLMMKIKSMEPMDLQGLLYPMGRLLWFVPHEALKRSGKNGKVDDEHDESGSDDSKQPPELLSEQHKKSSSLSESMSNLFSGFKGAKKESSNDKKMRKYGPGRYALCEATECRHYFQELVFDFPDSILTHLPPRYLWACGTSITNGHSGPE